MPKYIEREALLKSDDWQSLKSDFDKARAHIIILGQPAADVVEVVHGEWVNVKDFGGGNCFADCSICGTQEKAPNPTALKLYRRHCSYCGAIMDGERKSDNDQH